MLRLLFLLAVIAFAQSGGTISGTITDPDGQPVAVAPMQFKHVETGKLFNTSSSWNGTLFRTLGFFIVLAGGSPAGASPSLAP